MLSNYLGVLGVLATAFGFLLAMTVDIKILGFLLPAVGGFLCLLAIPLGGLSFFLRPKKTTYGGVTGYMRAIIGILCGLIGIVAAPAAIWYVSTLKGWPRPCTRSCTGALDVFGGRKLG